MDDTQAILGELRRLRGDYDVLASHVSIETGWIRARDHVTYGLSVLRQIPFLSRLAFFLGVCAFGFGLLARNGKAIFVGFDLLALSLLFVGQSA